MVMSASFIQWVQIPSTQSTLFYDLFDWYSILFVLLICHWIFPLNRKLKTKQMYLEKNEKHILFRQNKIWFIQGYEMRRQSRRWASDARRRQQRRRQQQRRQLCQLQTSSLSTTKRTSTTTTTNVRQTERSFPTIGLRSRLIPSTENQLKRNWNYNRYH